MLTSAGGGRVVDPSPTRYHALSLTALHFSTAS